MCAGKAFLKEAAPGMSMCCTCKNVQAMARMIQIRHVPDDIHRTLKARAAAAGMTLSDYLLRELREIADKPSLAELFDRIEDGPEAPLTGEAIVDTIRAERDARERRVGKASARRR